MPYGAKCHFQQYFSYMYILVVGRIELGGKSTKKLLAGIVCVKKITQYDKYMYKYIICTNKIKQSNK